MASKKLWGGRFSKPTDPTVDRFTSSIAVDYKLARYDVIGSIAHAKMLGRCRIIPAADSAKLVRGLNTLLHRIDNGKWQPDADAEDIHTQIQQDLEALIGPAALKVHTARSRNDQVALDLRLYCREAVGALSGAAHELQRALVIRAEEYRGVVIPGYTHLQRAQPVLLAHHLLAYVEMLERDRERLSDAYARIDVLPLGSGALAGTSLPIDRAFVAKELGFSRIAANSMDAVSDRDFVAELLSILALVSVHLSRLSEDFILWASEEFGLLSLDDAYATGSSLMPQKKNPDVLELIRGQAGLVIGECAAFLAVLKGLPLAYNRDLQWDKRCLFESVERTYDALDILSRLVGTLTIRKAGAEALLNDDALCATDLAELLVRKGVAFREAHALVGRIVAAAERAGCQLHQLPLQELRAIWPEFDRAALAVLDPRRSVERKRSAGGTGTREVSKALAQWHRKLVGKASLHALNRKRA